MNRRAFILNGAGHEDRYMDEWGESLTGIMQGRGWTVDALTLRERHVAPCKGCWGCWMATPGICACDDDSRIITRLAAQCRLLVFLTPVRFGGFSSLAKRGMEKIVGNMLPTFRGFGGELHHHYRYPEPPLVMGIGGLAYPDKEAEMIFQQQIGRNSMNLLHKKYFAASATREQGWKKLRPLVESCLSSISWNS